MIIRALRIHVEPCLYNNAGLRWNIGSVAIAVPIFRRTSSISEPIFRLIRGVQFVVPLPVVYCSRVPHSKAFVWVVSCRVMALGGEERHFAQDNCQLESNSGVAIFMSR